MDADVCVVGAGAAGGIIAAELARRGVAVLVLESGVRHDLRQRPEYVRRYLRGQNPWRGRLAGQDAYTVGGRVAYALDGRRGRGIGGSTLAWEGYALRFHADDFRVRSLHGVADDWPIGYGDLEPYYARAEAALGVAGSHDDGSASPRSTAFPLPAFAFSYSDTLFARACGRLGVAMQHLPQARNSVAYGGRPPCQACGTCHVCPTGAKASTDLTHVPAAEATGKVRVVPEATVLRLEARRSGQVTSAVYTHADRVERRASAAVFVLAAGGVENARLLLLSTSSEFPDGLANRSGLVGKRFMAQPSVDVVGRIPDRSYPYRIGFSTAMSRQFGVGAERAARAGFFLEYLNSAGPRPHELAVGTGLTGVERRRRVQAEFGRHLGVRIYADHLPDLVNTVSLNRRLTDYFGSAAPHISYRIGRYERDGLDAAKQMARGILQQLGATGIETTVLSPAAHQIGTHRMGVDPRVSVVDSDLRAHDVENLYLVGSGAFVTASASPPTLTIAALAIRAAERIAGRLGKT